MPQWLACAGQLQHGVVERVHALLPLAGVRQASTVNGVRRPAMLLLSLALLQARSGLTVRLLGLRRCLVVVFTRVMSFVISCFGIPFLLGVPVWH